ncbi:MAG: hypothetical protein OEZ13_09445 [Spirochaetia bacterium]|nr:hypothetical protein [Spirochaetia bacterium]
MRSYIKESIKKNIIFSRLIFLLIFLFCVPHNLFSKEASKENKSENYIAIQNSYINLYESASEYESYSSATLYGADIALYKKLMQKYMLNFGLSYNPVIGLTVNDIEIDFENYSWSTYNFYARFYYEFFQKRINLSLGGGFDLFLAGAKYYENMAEENSEYADLLISLGGYMQLPFNHKISMILTYNFSLNLTPGTREFVGINNLLSIQNKLSVGALYKL